MSSDYGPDVLNPRTDVKNQVLEVLRDPIAALMLNRGTVPYDRLKVGAADIPWSAVAGPYVFGSSVVANSTVASPGVMVTSLPASPVNGQEVYYQPAGLPRWHLVWDSSISRWVYLGGAVHSEFVAAAVTTSSNAYPGAGQGPSLTIPRAGTYTIILEAQHQHASAAANFTAAAYGQAVATDERAPVLAANTQVFQTWTYNNVSLNAGTLSMWFRSPGAVLCTYKNRRISVLPVGLT